MLFYVMYFLFEILKKAMSGIYRTFYFRLHWNTQDDGWIGLPGN